MAAPDPGAPGVSRIKPLPEHLVNKIAAGEVVERPASVVKELVENALDAEATHITVDLRDSRPAARARADDGVGMTAAELGWALTRHATSKIATDADLDAIQTLGFRGEALPAICAVSRFSLLSCAKGAVEGALLRGEGRSGGGAPGGPRARRHPRWRWATSSSIRPRGSSFLKAARTELALTLRLLHGHRACPSRGASDGDPRTDAPRSPRPGEELARPHGRHLRLGGREQDARPSSRLERPTPSGADRGRPRPPAPAARS
jgi:DNA mismatch repair protein MutL